MRLRTVGLVSLSSLFCLGALGACGDDDSGDNNNLQQDAAVDASAGESLTFIVVTDDEDATGIPAAGATVAFDAPGGERTEVVTGADGKATFHGIDWSAGTAAVTFHLDGYALVSSVNLTPARFDAWPLMIDGAYALQSAKLVADTPATVTLTGSATGFDDVAHNYTVNEVNNVDAASEWTGTGTREFTITVPSGESFILQAVEADYTALPSGQGYDWPVYNRIHSSFGPLTADASDVVLDFVADAMPSHTADVTMAMPPRADSPLRTGDIPYCFYCATNSHFCYGWPTHLDVVDSQTRIDLTFQWVEPTWAENPFWFCQVTTDTSEKAYTRVPWTSQPGNEPSLIDTPTWVTPSDTSGTHALHDAREWTWYEDVPISGLEIARAGRTIWFVIAGANATTATVPLAPSSVNEAQYLGSTSILRLFGGTTTTGSMWRRYDRSIRSTWMRYAQSRPIRVEP